MKECIQSLNSKNASQQEQIKKLQEELVVSKE
jgi:hypothetical protein